MGPYHRPHCLALGGRVTSPSSARPVFGEKEAALGRLPLLWVCLPFCPSTCYPLLCFRGPLSVWPHMSLCLCVSWPHVSLYISVALGGSLQGGHPTFPLLLPPSIIYLLLLL